MKIKLLGLLLILLICGIGCNKINQSNSPLLFKTVDAYGCNFDKSAISELSMVYDTLIVSDDNSELKFSVELLLSCCGKFKAESEQHGDTIKMKVISVEIGNCDCACIYNFDFVYKNYYKQKLYYQLYFDDRLKFKNWLNE